MADHQQGAFIALEPRFKPHQSIQVQVIGRFIQQQQFGGAHQGTGKLQSHTPSTRKTVDRLVQFKGFESQALYQRLRTGCGIVFTCIMQGHVGVGHALTVVCGFGCSHLGTCCHQLGVAFNHKVCCTGIGLRHVLGHLAHAPLRGNVKLTGVFGQRFVEQGEQ